MRAGGVRQNTADDAAVDEGGHLLVRMAFGNACQQWLVETKAANPGLCDGDDCTLVNVGFATAMTVFSAMVVLILKPFADRIEWGDGACTNFFEFKFRILSVLSAYATARRLDSGE